MDPNLHLHQQLHQQMVADHQTAHDQLSRNQGRSVSKNAPVPNSKPQKGAGAKAALALGTLGLMAYGMHRISKRKKEKRASSIHPNTLVAFEDELEKIANFSPTTLGAMAGMTMALGSDAMNEWDSRHREVMALRAAREEDRPMLQMGIEAERAHRLKRMVTRAAIAGAAGAGLGYSAGKAYESAVSGIHSAGRDVAEAMGKSYGQGMEQAIPNAVAKSRENLRGSFWDLFKFKK